MARILRAALAAAVTLACAGASQAAGGNYVFDGGTAKQRAQVRAALDASAFNWSLVPAQITIQLAPGTDSFATPGHVYLDSDLLAAGRFAWATVQDEYAHQVDFFLFDDATRAKLAVALGARDWCYGVAGLKHSECGCERFASTLVWSYWPSKDNSYKPTSKNDESAAMPPAKFRSLMAQLVGAPSTLSAAVAGRQTCPQAPAAPADTGFRAGPPGGVRLPATLLVCDDEEVLRALIRATLDGSGYSLVEARDGDEALEKARRVRPDVIVLDMTMPGRSGLDVLAELRRDPELSRTPVLMLTARTQVADREAAAGAGADRFLAKPFSPAELVSVVDELLERLP